MFVEPTMFADVNDMTIGREEIFGPVASIIPFDSEEEAIEMANDTIYGLCASVWTSNVSRAHNMAKAIESGMVYVNCYDVGDMTLSLVDSNRAIPKIHALSQCLIHIKQIDLV